MVSMSDRNDSLSCVIFPFVRCLFSFCFLFFFCPFLFAFFLHLNDINAFVFSRILSSFVFQNQQSPESTREGKVSELVKCLLAIFASLKTTRGTQKLILD